MKLGNRQSQHDFSRIPEAEIQRSKFNRSFGRKQTFDADYLVPIFLDEVLPGDTFNLNLTAFARLATPIAPIMDNIYLDYFFFFVPNRLVWNNWQKFNGEQEDPGDSTDYLIPTATTTTLTVTQNTLQNYMGLPLAAIQMQYTPVSALPFRAYNLIWNEWFRDQNLQNSIVVDKDDGPDDPADYVLKKRGKRHDYFTSALPWPQKGPAVSLPLGTTAPVFPGNTTTAGVFDGWSTTVEDGSRIWRTDDPVTTRTTVGGGAVDMAGRAMFMTPYANWPTTSGEMVTMPLEGDTTYTTAQSQLFTDLSSASAATINALRQAFQIQRLYERDARGGTRYTEIIRSHFGVISPDARLQRPEYLGGGRAMVNVAPVAQTSSTDATTPQGNLAAFGTSVTRNVGFQKSFTEHGYIIGLVSARADLSYQQGVNRMWMRQTRFDFYWPALSHLGEQVVYKGEIYIASASTDADPLGYQERYAEYRYKPSEILGTFMSDATGTLDIWHLAQDFSSQPSLNGTFIESSTPMARVIAVETEPHFLWDGWYQLICARPMPAYSVPGLVDHF